MLSEARKDGQLIDKDWQKLAPSLEGVVLREVRHVPRDHGIITEVFRPEWDPTGLPVVQVYQSRLFPGAIGAWSCHARTTDRLFVNQGQLKVVLYDDRDGSATRGKLAEMHLGDPRPGLVVIPPGIWHGLQNVGTSDALVLNCPTEAYNYEDPDHYRLPYDAPQIPYEWTVDGRTRLRSNAR